MDEHSSDFEQALLMWLIGLTENTTEVHDYRRLGALLIYMLLPETPDLVYTLAPQVFGVAPWGENTEGTDFRPSCGYPCLRTLSLKYQTILARWVTLRNRPRQQSTVTLL